MIDRATIDRIYATADIVEVISDYVTLRKKGVNYQACCPFHNEKTPSFVVSPSKGVYKCFGCGKGGNAITFVMEHDWTVVADAIRRELQRGGQVYYLHNRIEDIERTARRISELVPEAAVNVAHGQMDRAMLARVMDDVVNGQIQVLVCTTIIETGVDLPNANTLVIENADRFGLAQLHQIRGRVGRSERQAYAYFTYRKGKALSEVAEKRLAAIREYAEFGAGFRIALCASNLSGRLS